MQRVISWLFRDRKTGRIVIAQVPNAALTIFIVVRVIGAFLNHGGFERTLHYTGDAALGWWAIDELVRGVNPFRRVLGAVVAAVLLASLI